MTQSKILGLAPAALLAGGFLALLPRVVVANLENEGIAISQDWRRGLLVLASLGLAVAVCGGGALSGKMAVTSSRGRGVMLTIWLLVMVGLAVLVAVRMIADNVGLDLQSVLTVEFFTGHALYVAYFVIVVLLGELAMVAGLSAYSIQRDESLAVDQLAEDCDAALDAAALAISRQAAAEDRGKALEEQVSQLRAELQMARAQGGSKMQEQVYTTLLDSGAAVSVQELSEACSATDGTTRNALKRLIDDGLVAQVRPPADANTKAAWWYQVTGSPGGSDDALGEN